MAWFLQGARVQGESPITVIKLWLYAAVSLAVGAWITPLLYNAGKALAEVSSRKTTNDALEWLAKRCEVAELPSFFGGAVLLVAAVLFFPWMEWIYTRSKTRGPSVGRWFLELPESETPAPEPDASRHFGGLRGACRGFAMVAGLVLVMSLVLVPSRDFVFRMPAEGLWRLCLRSFSGALLLALVMELFFRGIALGIFIRAMKPVAAVGMSAVFFACLLALNPPPGLNVADPDASGTGFELLGRILTNDAVGRNFVGTLISLLALGGVLGYARWRSAALWLPIGLHAGWVFGTHLSGRLIVSTSGGRSFPIGTPLQESIIPLIAILLAGVFVYRQFLPADAPTSPQAA